MSSSTSREFQSLLLKIRVPLIWIGSAISAFGIYRTYSFLKKERQMYAFLERHPVDSEQASYVRKAAGLQGDAVSWKIIGVGLAFIILGLLLERMVEWARKSHADGPCAQD